MDALLKRPIFFAILAGMLTAAPPSQSTPPRFEDFPVITVYRGSVRPPYLAIQTGFKERIYAVSLIQYSVAVQNPMQESG
jgi:hypothetical protein